MEHLHFDELNKGEEVTIEKLAVMKGEVVYRHEFEDVLDRVKYLEKKLGIDSGMQTRFAS